MLRIVDARRGRFLVFDNDQYVGRSLIELGEFCEAQAVFFDSVLKPDAIVVEIGANIGAHTVVLAKRAAYVYAFEPQRRVYNVLCGNMAMNECDNVECHRVAAGERKEVVNLPVLDFSIENNFGALSLDHIGESNAFDPTPAEAINIPCDFLKIDVEGWEANVIRGSSRMIKQCSPVIYIENDRAAKSDDLIRLLNDLGYKCYWHETNLFNPNNFRGVENDIFGNCISKDMLCLPANVQFDALPEAKANMILVAA